jgi:hypothetical protein
MALGREMGEVLGRMKNKEMHSLMHFAHKIKQV